MIHKGFECVDKGANPVFLREGIERAGKAVAEKLLNNSKKVDSDSDIESVATISSSSAEIGHIIAEAMKLVGKNGVISVDESKGFDTELQVVKGLQYDKGYISPYMVTDREKTDVHCSSCSQFKDSARLILSTPVFMPYGIICSSSCLCHIFFYLPGGLSSICHSHSGSITASALSITAQSLSQPSTAQAQAIPAFSKCPGTPS